MRHRLFGSRGAAPALRRRIGALYAVLIALNLGAWAWALVAFRDYPLLLGTALLAYGFGLRHAVDADHIAAIDNVTRKLMQAGKRPAAVGFFFSLGHSTVVLLASFAIAMTAVTFLPQVEALRFIGTAVSILFLFAIAAANLMVLRAIGRGEADVAGGGFLARFFRPLFRLIGASWQLYPLGFLFGLGFDTATEIGLLDISAIEAAKGLSLWSIMIFPTLFTAGMALVDTSDGVLMLGAYGWALRNPLRKLRYNVAITAVSVVVAVFIGGVEALGLIGDRLGLDGAFWRGVGALNGNFGSLGYAIIALFAASWLISMAVYRHATKS